jgi:hypothetical protein
MPSGSGRSTISTDPTVSQAADAGGPPEGPSRASPPLIPHATTRGASVAVGTPRRVGNWRGVGQPRERGDGWAEFYEVLNDLAGADYAARAGLRLVREQARASAAERSIPKQIARSACPTRVRGHGLPNLVGVHRFRIIFTADGAAAHLPSQQRVVFVTAQKDGHYRTRVAVARGAKRKEDVLHPVLGDLNKIEMTSSSTAEWPPQTTRDAAPRSSGSRKVITSRSRPNTSPNSWLTSG